MIIWTWKVMFTAVITESYFTLFFYDCFWWILPSLSVCFFRIWGNVCRSVLLFCEICAGKEARKYLFNVSDIESTSFSDYVKCHRILYSLLCSDCCNSDLFNSDHLQLTSVFLVLPCLLLGYLGQAIYLIVIICSLPLYFSFCLAFCWVIWAKLHTLWNITLKIWLS
jgi:hypothetical protein